MSSPNDVRELRGLCASVCTTGLVTHPFSMNFSNLRNWNTVNGFVNVEYRHFDAKLVEEGRDRVLKHALKNDYDYVLMIDGDAAPFPENSLARLLKHMFVSHPSIDAVGAYCQLKGPPHLPTIDTGTGTWEPLFPGQGLIGVIRTGGHFLCVKTLKLKRFGPPWFRTRKPLAPARALKEVDNYARIKLDGNNPLAKVPEWTTLLQEATKTSNDPDTGEIGEDSGFCDNLKSIGGEIAVDTDLVVGHVATKIIEPHDLKEALEEHERNLFLSLGVGNYD